MKDVDEMSKSFKNTFSSRKSPAPVEQTQSPSETPPSTSPSSLPEDVTEREKLKEQQRIEREKVRFGVLIATRCTIIMITLIFLPS